MEDIVIREVYKSDCERLVQIYNPYILNTTVTYEYEPVKAEEMENRVNYITREYPWIVCEVNGVVAGYAYASRYHDRAAFDWNSEVSIYIDESYQKQGIGKKLYDKLFNILDNMGICNVYALIDYPYPASENFHKKYGFEIEAIEKNIGFKHGHWTNLMIMVLRLKMPDIPDKINHCWRDFM